MLITDITVNKGKASVYFDGIRIFTVRSKDIKNADIRIGTEIDPETFAERIGPGQRTDCYEAALCVLDVSAQTGSALKRKLRDKGYLDSVCDETVLKLRDIGLINDQRYTERIVECEKSKAVSAGNVRRKLMAKGIDRDIVDEALETMDEAQQTSACRKAIIPLLRRYRDNEPRVLRQKTAQALARKGFSWDIVSGVLDEYLIDERE